MKRAATVLGLSLMLVLSLATAAFAGYPPTKAPPPAVPAAPQGGVAVTGTNIMLGLVILAVLVVAGTSLVMATRRRRALSS